MNVVMAGAEMIPFSATKMASARARSQALKNDVMRISQDSHIFIFEGEIGI